jgi:pyruvate/2-oxoacid:ferredoxin oxidoreductase beta subunit
MDKFSLYVPNFLPVKEFFDPAKNNACPGCGMALAIRQTYKAVADLIERASWQAPAGKSLFGSKTAVSILAIKTAKGEAFICLDNEAGGGLDDAVAKKMPAMAVAEGFKYVATASPSYPFDLYDKMKRAIEAEGRAYVHVLCPCPVGWQFEEEATVKVGFLAVESQAFPLYEVGGGSYNLTVKTLKPRPVAEYLRMQARFTDLSEAQLTSAADAVAREYARLLENIERGLAYTYETTGKVF